MDNDLDIQPFIKGMQNICRTPVSALPAYGWGTIKSINPLVLIATNGMEIPETLLERSPFCYEWTTKRLEHSHKYDDHDTGKDAGGSRTNVDTSKEIPTLTLWRELQVGDKVSFLRINNSQKFIILWRENQFDLEG